MLLPFYLINSPIINDALIIVSKDPQTLSDGEGYFEGIHISNYSPKAAILIFDYISAFGGWCVKSFRHK